MKPLLLILSIAFGLTTITSAQSSDGPKDGVQPDHYHQIFLKDTVQQLDNVEYDRDDLQPIEYRLSEDKTAIHLYNYDGNNRVSVTYTNTAGESRSFSKPSCHIHALPTL